MSPTAAPPRPRAATPFRRPEPAPPPARARRDWWQLLRWPVPIVGLLLVLYAGVLAMADRPGRRAVPLPQPLQSGLDGEVVRWLDPVTLAETDEVINVSPIVHLDAGGQSFLVADARESQVRTYRRDGTLLGYFGRAGNGPGEFRQVSAALRTADGRVLTVDMDGRLTLFSAAGEVLETQRPPVGPIFAATLLDEGTVVLSGRLRDAESPHLVHLWNFRERRLEASFHSTPEHPRELEGAYAFTGFANVAVRGSELAVLHSLDDVVHVYDRRGTLLRTLPVPFRGFRPIAEPTPTRPDAAELARWTGTFSTVSQIFWTADGTFWIQYFDTRGAEMRWSLLRMDARGRAVFERRDTPQLLSTSPDGSVMVFERPGAEAANEWTLAARP